MLLAYRRTGHPRYLASFLRAADWLASAFVDNKAKGWAQQYDEHNHPIRARHFEPAAISLSEGIHSAPRMLMLAWRLTGEARYLAPARTWRQWMLDNRVFTNPQKTAWGWHTYYDPDDGKPFLMAKGKRIAPDPRLVRDGGFTAVLREIEHVERPAPPPHDLPARARERVQAEERMAKRPLEKNGKRLRGPTLVESFDWHAGAWLSGAARPSGQVLAPFSIRVALVSYSVFLRRQLAGQLPWEHRMSTLGQGDWGDPFAYLVPPHLLARRLTADELRRARACTPAAPSRQSGSSP
jgi:hypothetical protein